MNCIVVLILGNFKEGTEINCLITNKHLDTFRIFVFILYKRIRDRRFMRYKEISVTLQLFLYEPSFTSVEKSIDIRTLSQQPSVKKGRSKLFFLDWRRSRPSELNHAAGIFKWTNGIDKHNIWELAWAWEWNCRSTWIFFYLLLAIELRSPSPIWKSNSCWLLFRIKYDGRTAFCRRWRISYLVCL